MIITNVCLLLEALSIVICLHHLYGEKFRLDIATVCYLSIDMIIVIAVNFLGMAKEFTMVIYPILIIYCGLRFGLKIRALFINNILCMVLISGIQMLMAFLICHLLKIHVIDETQLLVVNLGVFLIVLLILPKCKLEKMSLFLDNKERFLICIISICLFMAMFLVYKYKQTELLEINQSIFIFISIFFVFLLAGLLGKYKLKAKEIETELKMQRLYSDSFKGLIDDIRLRQHEFGNHINTIYSQHYTCKTYEELVNTQKEYCELISKENQYNKLSQNGNHFIIGFLYGKLSEIEKKGIEITYRISVEDVNIGIPIHKIIEILGDLLNNAVEALENMEDKNKLFISIEEKEDFIIEVKNESDNFNLNDIGLFFERGYSKKGQNRGLGLYNVKQICKEYQVDISCEIEDIEDKKWIAFKLTKKGTI